MSLRLRETYQVQFDSIDFAGKMSLNGICNYMQIIAAHHASNLGFNYYKNSTMPEYYWILSRVKYVIDTYPTWEDEIQIETYPGGCEKLFAVRLFDICDIEGKKLGYIIGDYILMDAAKKRPARIKGNTGSLAFLDFPYEGESLPKLKVPRKGESYEVLNRERRKAYYSEMDLNGHMNNAHYVRWTLDMLPLELLKEKEVSSLEINYNTSITYGTEVEIILTLDERDGYMVYGNSLDGETNYFAARVCLR
ncbi:MAG: thioesterase [Cellulosilyticum sp.]|nr:thioesterase [Cellulosilyticum sp.]